MPSPAISVVIPALNEAERIRRTIARAASDRPAEIIVADGGSGDDTRVIAAAAGARVIDAPRGRGPQMNAGAGIARGGVLLFLHADTLLPPGWGRHVRATLARPGVAAGAFGLRIDGPGVGLRRVERAVARRGRRQRPYGDQALFLAAGTFRAIGGFPDWPLLEDVELVRRVRRHGRVAIASAEVLTSDRRWRTRGVARATLVNQACLLGYRLGVDPHRLARWRDGGAPPDPGPKAASA